MPSFYDVRNGLTTMSGIANSTDYRFFRKRF